MRGQHNIAFMLLIASVLVLSVESYNYGPAVTPIDLQALHREADGILAKVNLLTNRVFTPNSLNPIVQVRRL
jgi:hypothetical protein